LEIRRRPQPVCRSFVFGPVPRFYFHLYNDLIAIDEEGSELPNAAVALQRAITIAREIAAEAVRNGRLVLDHRIEVADEAGAIIGKIQFRDVVEVEG
jgi:hypothetical protein